MFKNYIWIIEDTKTVAYSLKDILKEDLKREEEVLIFHTAEDALKCEFTPSIAFVDFLLPGEKGDALVNYIEKRNPFCVIIGITAYYEIKNIKSMLTAGADEIVEKPITLKKVKKALEYATETRMNKILKLQVTFLEKCRSHLERLIPTKEKKKALEKIAESLLSLLNCDRVSIMERRGNKMVVIIAKGVDAEKLLNKEVDIKESISGYVATRKKDFLALDTFTPSAKLEVFMRKEVEASLLSILDPDGTLIVSASNIKGTFTPPQEKLFYFFTRIAEVLLQDVEIEESIIEAFSTVLHIRDFYTYTHSTETARLAVKIGKRLKLDETRLEQLRIGALLHDIGKIMVEEEVLKKPGSLTEEEREKMKKHPIYALRILKHVPGIEGAKKIILQHHERINGKGYPKGLTENEILLEAKILAVVDVFHALISHRPYRPARSLKEAIDELRKDDGLDQSIVEILVDIIKEETSKESTFP